jgi:hypothetical protein
MMPYQLVYGKTCHLPVELEHKSLQAIKKWNIITPGFKAKPNAHSMCAQELSLHTYCTENRYKITNIIIYSIYY